MDEGREDHVWQRFGRLLAVYRRPDNSGWGGQDLEEAAGGAVTRSYVSNLRNGRIENPGLAKLEAIAGAVGFPPQLWFGDAEERAPEAALAVAPEDGTSREIVAEVPRMGPRDSDSCWGSRARSYPRWVHEARAGPARADAPIPPHKTCRPLRYSDALRQTRSPFAALDGTNDAEIPLASRPPLQGTPVRCRRTLSLWSPS